MNKEQLVETIATKISVNKNSSNNLKSKAVYKLGDLIRRSTIIDPNNNNRTKIHKQISKSFRELIFGDSDPTKNTIKKILLLMKKSELENMNEIMN